MKKKTAIKIFENKFGIPLHNVIAIPSVPIKFIIELMEEYAQQFKLNKPAVSNCSNSDAYKNGYKIGYKEGFKKGCEE